MGNLGYFFQGPLQSHKFEGAPFLHQTPNKFYKNGPLIRNKCEMIKRNELVIANNDLELQAKSSNRFLFFYIARNCKELSISLQLIVILQWKLDPM